MAIRQPSIHCHSCNATVGTCNGSAIKPHTSNLIARTAAPPAPGHLIRTAAVTASPSSSAGRIIAPGTSCVGTAFGLGFPQTRPARFTIMYGTERHALFPASSPATMHTGMPLVAVMMPSAAPSRPRWAPLPRVILASRGNAPDGGGGGGLTRKPNGRAAGVLLATSGDGNSGGGSDVVHIPADARILLIGVTGITGRSALQGLRKVAGPGRTSHTLLVMTRNPNSAAVRSLPGGVQVVCGDLDDPASLARALQGVTAVYCHALSKDAATADPEELIRARNLAQTAKAAGVRLILYNSSGGRGCGYGITQMEQKHQVEDILAAAVPTVALRASMFMEELWKRYTRPGILKGAFTWSTPGDRPIQLVAARDLGLAVGCLLTGAGGDGAAAAAPATSAGGGADVGVPQTPSSLWRAGPSVVPAGQGGLQQQQLRLLAIELSGDELTPEQMCGVFARVQGGPVRHNRVPAWPFWFLARDVFRISRFLTERGYDGNVAACQAQFPGMLTFEQFLRSTGWADPSKTFEEGMAFGEVPAAAQNRQPPADTEA